MPTATIKIDADEVLERIERRLKPTITAACDLAETVNRVLDQAEQDTRRPHLRRSSERLGTMLLADEVAELKAALQHFAEQSGEVAGELEDEGR